MFCNAGVFACQISLENDMSVIRTTSQFDAQFPNLLSVVGFVVVVVFKTNYLTYSPFRLNHLKHLGQAC